MTPNPLKSHHSWSVPLKSVALGFCVFFLGSVLAAWQTLNNVHGFLAFVDNFMAGIAAGLMVLLYERWRQREVDKKLRTVRLMNHHVRNALQIILAASCDLDGTEQSTRVRDAVRRIEWALREVLPGEIEPTDAAAPPQPGTPRKESAA
ncbi:MAG: hypothetical protein ACHQIK_22515 [Candidatus Acidiferrales bacterium]